MDVLGLRGSVFMVGSWTDLIFRADRDRLQSYFPSAYLTKNRSGSWSSRGEAYSATGWKCVPILANGRSRSDTVLNLYDDKLGVVSHSATLTAKVKQINPMEESKMRNGGLGNAMRPVLHLF